MPENIYTLLEDLFAKLTSIGSETTNWQTFDFSITTGCTISVISFAAAMNLLYGKMKILCSTLDECVRPSDACFMGKMKFRPAKSQRFVLKKEKVANRYRIKIKEKLNQLEAKAHHKHWESV